MRWAAGLAAVATLTMSSAVSADEVSTTGKGITGGALLGAEAVMLTEAAIGVKPGWAYAVGGLAGGVGGGVAGYFIEDSASAKVNMYLLVAGMALAIPTTVVVLDATAYEPPVDYTQDRAPADEPVAEPPRPEGKANDTRRTAQRRTQPKKTLRMTKRERLEQLRLHARMSPPALVGMHDGALTLSVPAVEVRDVYTLTDMHRFAIAKQETELRVPVVKVSF